MQHVPPPTHWVTDSQFHAALRRRRLVNGALAIFGAMLLLFALVGPATGSQEAATRSTSGPAPTTEPADAVLDRLLRDRDPSTTPSTSATRRGAAGTAVDTSGLAGAMDRASGSGNQVVAPDTPPVRLVREGSYVIDRSGRVVPSRDGSGLEFIFESDGATAAAAVEPAMLLVPNLNLMAVERTLEADRDRRFRVTGRVTEYRGRNYLLLEKVIFLN